MAVSVVYASPLRRAIETAEIIGGDLGPDALIDSSLRQRLNWDRSRTDAVEVGDYDGTAEIWLDDVA